MFVFLIEELLPNFHSECTPTLPPSHLLSFPFVSLYPSTPLPLYPSPPLLFSLLPSLLSLFYSFFYFLFLFFSLSFVFSNIFHFFSFSSFFNIIIFIFPVLLRRGS